MKKYLLTAEIHIDEYDVRNARKWEKRNNLSYKDDVAHLLLDYLTDGETNINIKSVIIDDIKKSESEFKKFINSR